jgi:hypothetical protein
VINESERRNRIFSDFSVDNEWEKIINPLYHSHPELDSSKNLFIRLNNGLGDRICTLGLLTSWRRYFLAKNVIAVADIDCEEVIEFFPNVVEAVVYVVKEPNVRGYVSGSVYGVLHRPTKARAYGGILEPWFSAFKTSYLDRYRFCMRLPPWSNFEPPEISDGSPRVDLEVVSRLRGGVILAPFSKFIKGVPFEAWLELAKILSQSGHPVFVNVSHATASSSSFGGDAVRLNQILQFGEALDCSLSTLLAAAPHMLGLITPNSGLGWLMANKVRRTVVLHPASRIERPHGKHSHCQADALIDVDRLSSSMPWLNGLFDIAMDGEIEGVCDRVVECLF